MKIGNYEQALKDHKQRKFIDRLKDFIYIWIPRIFI